MIRAHLRRYGALDRTLKDREHALLVPVLGWFTEGLDTPDLKKARALLDGLSQ